MGEFWKDCQYIAKTIKREFPLMATIKISLIPVVAGFVAWLASFWDFLKIPGWVWIPVTIFTSVVCILFALARKSRILEEPKFELDSHFPHYVAASPIGSGIYLKYANILVKAHPGANLKECVAELIGITRDGGETDFDRPVPLIWNEPVNSKVTSIIAGSERVIHVVKVDNRFQKLNFCGEPSKWNRLAYVLSKTGIYKFEVLVNCDGISKPFTLEVDWNGKWGDFQIREN